MAHDNQELNAFLDAWNDTPERIKDAFRELKATLAAMPGVVLDFLPRPGVTYSLRAAHGHQKDRLLFVMVDVIEDAPRWLSVCFYADMITDPDDKADHVPEGLLGQDAMCFDIDTHDSDTLNYIHVRMKEAYRSAAGDRPASNGL